MNKVPVTVYSLFTLSVLTDRRSITRRNYKHENHELQVSCFQFQVSMFGYLPCFTNKNLPVQLFPTAGDLSACTART